MNKTVWKSGKAWKVIFWTVTSSTQKMELEKDFFCFAQNNFKLELERKALMKKYKEVNL